MISGQKNNRARKILTREIYSALANEKKDLVKLMTNKLHGEFSELCYRILSKILEQGRRN